MQDLPPNEQIEKYQERFTNFKKVFLKSFFLYRKKQLVVDRDETISQLKLQLSDATRELDEQLSSHAKKMEAVLADKDNQIKVRFKNNYHQKEKKNRIF